MRLAQFDASAMAAFEGSVAGALRSFGVAIVLAPLYALEVAIDPANRLIGWDRALLVSGGVYLARWLVFPILLVLLAGPLGYWSKLPRYIAVSNWSRIIVAAVMLPFVVIDALSGHLGSPAVVVLFFVARSYVIMLEWFIANQAFGRDTLFAVQLVVVQQLLDLLIEKLSILFL